MSLAETLPPIPSLDALRATVGDDWADVNRTIVRRLGSDVALVNQVAHHIIHNGGKRLRPLAVLLAARACGCQGAAPVASAAIIEFIHTATLLHDDVVDGSGLRRGRQTANALFGNQASVLVGDFLYSRAFQMMVELEDLRVLDVLANATNTIAEGEVLQLMNCNNPDTSEADYMEVIYRKTAKLFEAGTRIGALLAGQDEPLEQALVGYGRHLGQAFQLVDDALDYDARPEEFGKNIGDDLAEGKPTLPLILAIARSDPRQAERLRRAITSEGLDALADVLDAIHATGALEASRERAHAYARSAREALSALPRSTARDALDALADYAIDRTR